MSTDKKDESSPTCLTPKMRDKGRWHWRCKAWTVTATGVLSIALLGPFHFVRGFLSPNPPAKWYHPLLGLGMLILILACAARIIWRIATW